MIRKEDSRCRDCHALKKCLAMKMEKLQNDLANGEGIFTAMMGQHDEGLLPFMLDEMRKPAEAGAENRDRLIELAAFVEQYVEFADLCEANGDFVSAPEELKQRVAAMVVPLIHNRCLGQVILESVFEKLSGIVPQVRSDLEKALGTLGPSAERSAEALKYLAFVERRAGFKESFNALIKANGDFSCCPDEIRMEAVDLIADFMNETRDTDTAVGLAMVVNNRMPSLLHSLAETIESIGRSAEQDQFFFAMVLGFLRQAIALNQLDLTMESGDYEGDLADFSDETKAQIVRVQMEMLRAVNPPSWATGDMDALMAFPRKAVATFAVQDEMLPQMRAQLSALAGAGDDRGYFTDLQARFEAERAKIEEARAIETRVKEYFTSDDCSTAGILALVEESPALAEEAAKYAFTERLSSVFDRIFERLEQLAAMNPAYKPVYEVAKANQAGGELASMLFSSLKEGLSGLGVRIIKL